MSILNPILNPDDPTPRMPVPRQPSEPLPAPAPTPTVPPPIGLPPLNLPNQDTRSLPPDTIGDIPPPPVPAPPRRLPVPPEGLGAGGAPGGAEGGTFARPASVGIRPYRSATPQPPRFGPGVPIVGSTPVSGSPSGDLGLSPEEAAELLRNMVGAGG
jgi:hypothetical protein